MTTKPLGGRRELPKLRFPIWNCLEPLQARNVAYCNNMRPPASSALAFFSIFYLRSQFLGFYLSNTRFSSSLAGLSACCARIFPLAATVLASFACLSLH